MEKGNYLMLVAFILENCLNYLNVVVNGIKTRQTDAGSLTGRRNSDPVSTVRGKIPLWHVSRLVDEVDTVGSCKFN